MKLKFTQRLDDRSDEAIDQFVKMTSGRIEHDREGMLECEVLSVTRVPGTKSVEIVLFIKKEQQKL